MTNNVYWMLQVSINDGKLDDFKKLAEEMSTSTKDENGALAYEWHLTDDGSACHIYERYQDCDATMAHLSNFGSKFADRFMSMVKPVKFDVYGKVDDTVRGALKDFGPGYHSQIAGFTR